MSRAANEPLRRVTVTIDVEDKLKYTYTFPAAEVPRLSSEYHHGEYDGGGLFWERSPIPHLGNWTLSIQAHRDGDTLWTQTQERVVAPVADGLTRVAADINRPIETLPWHAGCAKCDGLRSDVSENGGLGLATLARAVCKHFERDHGEEIYQA